jgi:hypothetical protein
LDILLDLIVTLAQDNAEAQVNIVLAYPFTEPLNSVLPSNNFVNWYQTPASPSNFLLAVSITPAEYQATTSANEIYAERNADGTETFTTISGVSISPRVEIHPVVPHPYFQPPIRQDLTSFGFTPGIYLPCANPDPLTWTVNTPLNTMVNPSFIPVLSQDDPEFSSKVARIAVTYMNPGDIDTSYFTWVIKSGPIAFVGNTQGQTEVQVYGTSASTEDTWGEIELHWDGANGPLLCPYRAYVGMPKYVSFRANIISGTGHPPTAVDPLSRPDDVAAHIYLANLFLWQAGIHLYPDSDTQAWDHAILSPKAGIYWIKLPEKYNSWTIGVDPNAKGGVAATPLNFRPGVVNIVYIKSAVAMDDHGDATDRPNLPQEPTASLGDSPSSSWHIPSGIPPDAAAGTVIMNRMQASKRGTSPEDVAYAHSRGVPARELFSQLHAFLVMDHSSPAPTDQTSGYPHWGLTVAHELCHVLGLMHRGNGGWAGPGSFGESADGVNDPHNIGFPWFENVMGYPPPGVITFQNLDLDLIQTMVIRQHPLLHDP